MRHIVVLVLIIACLGSAFAFELGNQQNLAKNNRHVGQNPGTPETRQGGEDMESAYQILSIPFSDTGNTSGHLDDYDEVCPYSDSTSPDLVYKYQPEADTVLSVDFCGSSYDTKTYIYEGSGNLVFCNDDFYFDDTCGVYVSMIEAAYIYGGQTYYIVIDGYGGDAGEYILEINEYAPPPPCIIDCYDHEGEPAIVDGYQDAHNGGCNSPDFGAPFQELMGDGTGELVFCGQSGWYLTSEGGNTRDTDWFIATVGVYGVIEWTLDAEQETYGFRLGPNDCATVEVIDQMLVGPCAPLTMIIQGAPGDIVWLWIGPSVFQTPPGADNEYMWSADFTGLMDSCVDTEKVTFDGIKTLYR